MFFSWLSFIVSNKCPINFLTDAVFDIVEVSRQHITEFMGHFCFTYRGCACAHTHARPHAHDSSNHSVPKLQ